jgi:hypothetical protein
MSSAVVQARVGNLERVAADLTKRVPDDEPDSAGGASRNRPVDAGAVSQGAEVGDFRQGTVFSQWALARYLVGRALAVSVSNSLLVAALVVLGLAALLQWVVGSTFWAVVVAVVGLLILALRGLLRWGLNRLTAADRYAPLEQRLRALVSETKRDILAELRRVGLPGRSWSLPLLAIRLLRPSRRTETWARLRQFDVDRAVSPARVDELHHIMRAAFNRPGRAA